MSTPSRKSSLNLQSLEGRESPSVSSIWFSGSTLVVKINDVATTVEVRQSASSVEIVESGTDRSWSYAATSISRVEFQGGSGHDRFLNYISTMPVKAFGNGGNDYLEGYGAGDYLSGGIGNDTLAGYGGDDTLWGGTGNDVLLGMAGNDQLIGQDGDDRLNGRDGTDSLWGGNGLDVLIAIDNGTSDYVQGDAGRDSIWVDLNSTATDATYGVSSEDRLQRVAWFSNGADRTLNGDRITDPTVKTGDSYATFSDQPLFSTSGPRAADIRQGSLADCYFLAGLGAVAQDSAHAVRQNIVDFDDGTYGVRLGSNFYRVDNDLPIRGSSTAPAYAGFGAQQSMWVAIAEKAFAHYRKGLNSYESIEWGNTLEVNKAFGSTTAGSKAISSYASAATMGNDIYQRWNSYQAVTISFDGEKKTGIGGAPLIMGHAYIVVSVARNSAGTVTSISLRNPWGRDGAGNDGNTADGLVTVTPSQIFFYNGSVTWGRV